MHICVRRLARDKFASPKGRNVGVSTERLAVPKNAVPNRNGFRAHLVTYKEEAAAAKPRTGLGGVSRGVVPPLTNTWKQGSRNRDGKREGESPLGSGGSRSDGLRETSLDT